MYSDSDFGRSGGDPGSIRGGSGGDPGSIRGGSGVDPGGIRGGSGGDPGGIRGGSGAPFACLAKMGIGPSFGLDFQFRFGWIWDPPFRLDLGPPV
jgi:hypothetical protein